MTSTVKRGRSQERTTKRVVRKSLTRPPIIARQVPAWEAARRYIEEQIAVGTYPIDSWLPSVRDFAVQLGINRNTVSKAYQALGRDGLLRVVRGRGVRVAGKRANGHSSEAALSQQIEALAHAAHFYGLPREWLLQRVNETSTAVYAAASERVAFVECTDHETRSVSQDLTRHMSVEVRPLVLSDLSADPSRTLRELDLVATTFFHLREVTDLVGARKIEVVGINHAVSHESALAIARLKPGAVIAIVCPNERTLDRVKKIVESFARGEIRSSASDEPAVLHETLAGADVVIDTSMTHDAVVRERPDVKTITIKFHIEPQSIDYLRDAIQRHSVSDSTAATTERKVRTARAGRAP